MATETQTAPAPQEARVESREAEEFTALLKQSFRSRTERAAEEVENAVNTLVEQALADSSLIKGDVLDTIEEMIAQLDKKLSAQMNAIMHSPEFQQIESAWRGLKYLVFQSETDAMLKIRVMNVSKGELYRHLRQFPNAAWDQSPLFKKTYEEEFGQLGGQPYGCLIGDYQFSHLPTDVQLLRDLSKIAAASHAPFIAAADSTLMGMDSWTELMNPRDVSKLFATPEYAAWKSLRDSDDAKYLGLCMPRVLSRLPYGAKTEPVEDCGIDRRTEIVAAAVERRVQGLRRRQCDRAIERVGRIDSFELDQTAPIAASGARHGPHRGDLGHPPALRQEGTFGRVDPAVGEPCLGVAAKQVAGIGLDAGNNGGGERADSGNRRYSEHQAGKKDT